jgi:hypothetical protein
MPGMELTTILKENAQSAATAFAPPPETTVPVLTVNTQLPLESADPLFGVANGNTEDDDNGTGDITST